MTNGFYNTDTVKEVKDREALIKDAVMLSYTVDVQHLKSPRREINEEDCISDFIDRNIKDGTINVVNRHMYRQGSPMPGDNGEVSLTHRNDYMFIYMSIDNLNKLIKKYKLKLQKWPK